MDPTTEAAASLAAALAALEVDPAGMDYDHMTGELACIADGCLPRPPRAEEVTRNCHAIARLCMRHLRRPDLTPEQRRPLALVILALHECACEHDGADDWLDRAAARVSKYL
jgi:hypothetical protein